MEKTGYVIDACYQNGNVNRKIKASAKGETLHLHTQEVIEGYPTVEIYEGLGGNNRSRATRLVTLRNVR